MVTIAALLPVICTSYTYMSWCTALHKREVSLLWVIHYGGEVLFCCFAHLGSEEVYILGRCVGYQWEWYILVLLGIDCKWSDIRCSSNVWDVKGTNLIHASSLLLYNLVLYVSGVYTIPQYDGHSTPYCHAWHRFPGVILLWTYHNVMDILHYHVMPDINFQVRCYTNTTVWWTFHTILSSLSCITSRCYVFNGFLLLWIYQSVMDLPYPTVMPN